MPEVSSEAEQEVNTVKPCELQEQEQPNTHELREQACVQSKAKTGEKRVIRPLCTHFSLTPRQRNFLSRYPPAGIMPAAIALFNEFNGLVENVERRFELFYKAASINWGYQ
jgi:hypothetical protein